MRNGTAKMPQNYTLALGEREEERERKKNDVSWFDDTNDVVNTNRI